jgi:hypothetical protein
MLSNAATHWYTECLCKLLHGVSCLKCTRPFCEIDELLDHSPACSSSSNTKSTSYNPSQLQAQSGSISIAEDKQARSSCCQATSPQSHQQRHGTQLPQLHGTYICCIMASKPALLGHRRSRCCHCFPCKLRASCVTCRFTCPASTAPCPVCHLAALHVLS